MVKQQHLVGSGRRGHLKNKISEEAFENKIIYKTNQEGERSGHLIEGDAHENMIMCTHNQCKHDAPFDVLFLDFNYLIGFKKNIILKELAIVGRTKTGTNFQQHYLLRSPLCNKNGVVSKPPRFQGINRTTYDNLLKYHGINWWDGEVPFTGLYADILELLNNSEHVIVENRVKANHIRKVYKEHLQCTVSTMENDKRKIPNWAEELFKPEPMVCAFHINRPGKGCALNNARLFRSLYEGLLLSQ
ncbi:MAG: hypothetical protein E6K54_08610 [Gammaproteobacteria bacterium]|nr:MAG: hypothetical protein E6K54_08610 [Gammaproteobacteria bacterium]